MLSSAPREGSSIHDPAGAAQKHRAQCPDGGAAGRAKDVGVRQRIPQQDLHQRASEGQCRAGAEGGQRAGQAQAQDDVGLQ